jgi:hypothetical protein
MNEILGAVDAPVDVRLGREIHDGVQLPIEHQLIHRIGIRDVGFEKFVAFAMFFDHAVKIGEVAGVGQRINICDRGRLVMLQNVANKIAPNESAAAGNENSHSDS